jgi:hypothetical protein
MDMKSSPDGCKMVFVESKGLAKIHFTAARAMGQQTNGGKTKDFRSFEPCGSP